MSEVKTTDELLRMHPAWSYLRTDKNGTRYFNDTTCPRCGGRGGWEGWPGFTCYECGGSGRSGGTIVKIYVPEYEEKLRARRLAKAEKAAAERERLAIENRAENLKKAGFGKEEDKFVIYRVVGNTFPIKDELKALGCKFNYSVGWFSSTSLKDYECQRLEEKDVLTESIYIEWKYKKEIENLFIENIRAAAECGEWVGNIGDKIQLDLSIDRRFENSYVFNGHPVISYLYLMHDKNNNIFKWSTSSVYLNEGENVELKGTIKEHTTYKYKKQTVITRCKIVA